MTAITTDTTCEWCGQDIADPATKTCTLGHFTDYRDHPHVDRIRFGLERGSEPLMPDERCNDCGVAAGGFHHPTCDIEQCPVCFGQAIGCDCAIVTDDDTDQ